MITFLNILNNQGLIANTVLLLEKKIYELTMIFTLLIYIRVKCHFGPYGLASFASIVQMFHL
ncbi:hypothetical protein Hanom_Chr17g01544171 [Helianthus anomalus]